MVKLNLNSIPILRKIGDFLFDQYDFKAYLVGGFVRDLLIKETSKDIDIVVVDVNKKYTRAGIVFAERLTKYLGAEAVATLTLFENFGTANFKIDGVEIEIVGARKESYDRTSRKPIVEDGTLDDDLDRRDLTFNALASSLNPYEFGLLIDKYDGVKDLRAGIIRTPLDPNITFSDDPLRMCRAIRFASKFNFTIEESTLSAIKANRDRLDIISRERIVQEMNKILLSKKPSVGLHLLNKTGLLDKFLVELSSLDHIHERNGLRHKNNFLHTIYVVDQVREMTDDIVTLWAAIFHDIGKNPTKKFNNGWTFHGHEEAGARMVKDILLRLKMPVQEWGKKIDIIVRLHGRVKELAPDDNKDFVVTDSAIRRLVVEAEPYLDDLLLFSRCDMTTKIPEKRIKYLKGYDALEARIREVAEKDQLRNFKLPVMGEEIMERYQLKPSKIVGDLKTAMKDAVLDGVIPNDYEAAIRFLDEKFEELRKK